MSGQYSLRSRNRNSHNSDEKSFAKESNQGNNNEDNRYESPKKMEPDLSPSPTKTPPLMHGIRTSLERSPLITDLSKDHLPKAPMSEPCQNYMRSRLRRRLSENLNAFRFSRLNYNEDILLFKEQPRQFIILFFVISLVSYYTFTHDSNDLNTNIRSATFVGVMVFFVYCFLQTRDGLLVRPHPGVWRIVHGAGVVYLVSLAAISVQNTKGAKAALRVYFPEMESESSSDVTLDCTINANTLYQGVTSIWFVAHVTGWWGKMCMFRDIRLCWLLSISFEVLELILQFVIPHFQECWWDSLFMDMFGANLIGMILGRLTLRYLEKKEYDWGKKSGFVSRALGQFSPFSWSRYHWEVFSSFKRFAQVLLVIIICLLAELNAFFMLRTLDIPKESNFNVYRLLLIFLLGIPTASEYYEFISDPDCWRVGQNAWLMNSIICFEVLVWFKFFPEILPQSKPLPNEVIIPLIISGVLFFCWMIAFFYRQYRFQTAHVKETRCWELDLLFSLSFMPLLYLTKQWGY